tara:strand:+ start:25836 stop:26360 length:525 start_codon:yes stop_codon:yes gene_type:complete
VRRTVHIVDDFLTKECCDSVIEYYNSLPQRETDKYNKEVLLIGDTNNDPCPAKGRPVVLTDIWCKLEANAKRFGYALQWAQVYKWKLGSVMGLHTDVASTATTYTSVLWLNDEFTGGELHFKDGTRFQPVTGRIVWYDGINYPHKVLPVRSGTRWAIAAWYKDLYDKGFYSQHI